MIYGGRNDLSCDLEVGQLRTNMVTKFILLEFNQPIAYHFPTLPFLLNLSQPLCIWSKDLFSKLLPLAICGFLKTLSGIIGTNADRYVLQP